MIQKLLSDFNDICAISDASNIVSDILGITYY